MGSFKHPDISWKDNTAGPKQSRSEYIDNKFLAQVSEEPTKKVALLNVIRINSREEALA